MNDIEYLSREERIKKIGDLLAEGAIRLLIREAESKRVQEANPQPQEQGPQPPEVSHRQLGP